MTDNCDELKDALHAVWPKSRLLLCIFHLMQQVWRWLFDKKHGISQHDRPVIMAKFRKVVYAELETEMEEVYDKLLDSFGPKYPQLTSYLENVYDMRERWCLCYRRKMTIRGNNTNNFVEAQFLVLKDNILNRTKEININGLFEKLTKDFNDHYKSKLLSVANGRFDGIYSRRFMGKTKEKGEGVGYKLPPEPVLREVAENIISNGSNIYLVPSFTDPSVHYCVDMELGLCECDVGSDGSPCKHQYVTWRQHLKSANFIPYLSSEERKQCSYIAIGESLPDVYYEGLRDYLDAGTNVTESSGQSVHSDSESHDTIQQDPMDEGSTSKVTDERRSVETVNFQEIQTEFTEASEKILRMIELNRNNNDFLRGVSKFCDRISKYETQTSKLCSAFHTFASDIHYSKKVTNQTHSKSRTGKKIKVQPEAVKRRSTISGSKVAIQKGMTKRKNPFNVEPSLKRGHSFTKNVSNNEPVAKKAGRTMGSKTKFLTPQVKRPAIKKDSKQ
ncbi:uncharacterized protein LOC130649070 [Hydractinia symbiolongicarpus]|uniref:uncharacterized protein LOC130649070 n=1 Tax=Hydractinia symbiolongicarpus TaxID=13093 RepID=UPI00254BDF5E|nr:uncharacterized protein LOC130649070 [Hydractinia symbiolongicarpus]